jgi:hypothetical protein
LRCRSRACTAANTSTTTTSSSSTAAAAAASPSLDTGGVDKAVLELARQQHMNTEVKRAVFCVVMTAEDYLDAFEKVMRLELRGKQVRTRARANERMGVWVEAVCECVFVCVCVVCVVLLVRP